VLYLTRKRTVLLIYLLKLNMDGYFRYLKGLVWFYFLKLTETVINIIRAMWVKSFLT